MVASQEPSLQPLIKTQGLREGEPDEHTLPLSELSCGLIKRMSHPTTLVWGDVYVWGGGGDSLEWREAEEGGRKEAGPSTDGCQILAHHYDPERRPWL